MEVTTCGVCGNGEHSPYLRATDWLHGSHQTFNYVRCKACGLIYIRCRPDEAEISQYYPEHSYYTYQSTGQGVTPRPYHERLATSINQLAGGFGRLLDVGCGDGSFLAAMTLLGWEGIGTETHIPTVERLNSQGFNVMAGKLEELNFPDGHFNLMSMLEVIEHLHNPLEAVQEAHRLLAPNGMLYITTPNIRSVEFQLYKQRWVALEPPIHLQLFSPETLTRLLEAAGFSRIEMKTSASVAGLTRSFWLALRRGYQRSSSNGDSVQPEFVADSWRRSVHQGLNVILAPAGHLMKRLQLGPGLEALAYRD